jgi:aryl-alcohol dehydrogenase-like predicted oxidoreductase
MEMMEKRTLGRTGHQSTVVIMGTAAFWTIDQQGANDALDLILARGVNHIDVAPQYGNAELVTGPWLEHRRDQFFLGCKTLEREKSAAWADLRRSLERLRTNRLDLYQLHSVGTFEELDKAFAKGGSIETLKEAREQGITKYLGITGHGIDTPAVHAEALERFDFDTIMLPLNPALYANDKYRQSMTHLLKVAQERNVGVMIIKAIARGPWGEQRKDYNTWYLPFTAPEMIEQWIRFALSQPVTGIASAGDVRLLPATLDSADRLAPLSESQQEILIEQARQLEPLFV